MADIVRKVKVQVSGLHASHDTGEQEQIVHTYPGTCRKIDDAWYVQYQENEAEHGTASRVLLKIRQDCLEITRKGDTAMHLVLREGTRERGSYSSPFGTFQIAAKTRSLRTTIIPPAQDEFDIQAEYVLEMDGQAVSRAQLRIKVERA